MSVLVFGLGTKFSSKHFYILGFIWVSYAKISYPKSFHLTIFNRNNNLWDILCPFQIVYCKLIDCEFPITNLT